MTPLIAVDWGTSSLRAALLDEEGRVVDEHASARGILTVAPDEFASVLIAICAQWERAGGRFCLISGMAGSRQGWQEAPYCACPAGFADIASHMSWLEGVPGFDRLAIVPGLSHLQDGVPDVMRGEETQVFGALDLLGITSGTFVLPGTHSKWVRVEAGRIQGFRTFMTGEFYAMLRRHSILARTMPDGDDDGLLDEAAFALGIAHARRSANLLHAVFSARTLALFDALPAAALPSYLSGLVIGEELRSQALDAAQGPVVVIGADALTQRYEIALQNFAMPCKRVGTQATWRGLWAIAQTLESMQ